MIYLKKMMTHPTNQTISNFQIPSFEKQTTKNICRLPTKLTNPSPPPRDPQAAAIAANIRA